MVGAAIQHVQGQCVPGGSTAQQVSATFVLSEQQLGRRRCFTTCSSIIPRKRQCTSSDEPSRVHAPQLACLPLQHAWQQQWILMLSARQVADGSHHPKGAHKRLPRGISHSPANVLTLYVMDWTPSRSAMKRAKHRMPLPHISGSLPSALKMRIVRSVSPWAGSANITCEEGVDGHSAGPQIWYIPMQPAAQLTPSPPMPKFRSQSLTACSGVMTGWSECRLSTCANDTFQYRHCGARRACTRRQTSIVRRLTSMKSFPNPWYLLN
jgi:hypothetical protein